MIPVRVKLYVLSLWRFLDPLYYALTRLTYVDGPEDRIRNIFRVRLLTYRGSAIRLQDGTMLEAGDLLLKIHLHNVRLLRELLRLPHDVQKARHIYRSVERSLPGVAAYIRTHPRCEDIKGIIGMTMMYRGSQQLGFEIHPMTSRLHMLWKWMSLLPIYVLSVSQPFRKLRKQSPKYLIMSLTSLLHLYGKPAGN